MADTPTLHFDGASRGNPGSAGIGYAVENDGTVLAEGNDAIGTATNNEAEYHALIQGLRLARSEGIERLRVEGDSQLIVRQIRGEYGVNAGNLRPLYERATDLMGEFDSLSIHHVPREENSRADLLANEALD